MQRSMKMYRSWPYVSMSWNRKGLGLGFRFRVQVVRIDELKLQGWGSWVSMGTCLVELNEIFVMWKRGKEGLGFRVLE